MAQQQMTLGQAFELAAQHRSAGRRAEAASIYQQIIAAAPNQPDALHNLGVLAMEAGDHRAAVDLIDRAISIQPNSPHFISNLGIALRGAGRIEDAIAAYRRAAALNPKNASTWYNLGNVLSQVEQLPQAIEAYQAALQLKPDFADALYNLGNTFHQLGEFDRAIAAYEHAVTAKGDLATARYSLGIMHLRSGDLPRGFAEYEWRWNISVLGLIKPNFPQPMWDGGALNGRRIFLHAEQGLGDTMMIARYVSLVASRGAGKIILACQPELTRLLRSMPQLDAIISDGDPIPEFEVHCPLMSLPLVCKTTLGTIPSNVPYLKADPKLVAAWRQRMTEQAGTGKRVGLAWAGRPSHPRDRNRSIHPSLLSPLAKTPGMQFFSLQKGKAAELAQSSDLKLIDWTADLKDFADTAALVENLDLVITVDTSVAHVAGALGKPVWLLMPCVPDWRWLLKRTDSPWYPTMELFRQPTLNDWQTPIDQIARRLRG